MLLLYLLLSLLLSNNLFRSLLLSLYLRLLFLFLLLSRFSFCSPSNAYCTFRLVLVMSFLDILLSGSGRLGVLGWRDLLHFMLDFVINLRIRSRLLRRLLCLDRLLRSFLILNLNRIILTLQQKRKIYQLLSILTNHLRFCTLHNL